MKYYFFVLLLFLLSCSNDDDDNVEIVNTLSYQNTSYPITNGALIDLGPSPNTNGFREYAIELANDNIDITFPNNGISIYDVYTNESTLTFSVDIHSTEEGDITGTFPYRISGVNATLGYNQGIFISLDGNLDGDFIDENDLIDYIEEGVLIISGAAPNYVISVVSEFPDGSPLTFTYRGNLEPYQIP